MRVTPPQNFKLTAASSVNMKYSHEESLHSAVEEFSPQPSQSPTDFRDSDKDEKEEEEPQSFGVKPYMLESLSAAGRERESRLLPTTCGPAPRLITDSTYMAERFHWVQNFYTPLSAG